MVRKALRANPDEAKPLADMSENDKQAVTDQSSGSAKVVHEVVRLQVDEELGRPVQSLLFSGFAAGVAISASLLTESFLRMRLPRADWTELVVSFGYTVGFVIVILGKLQLFTESTVTAVLPLATHPTFRNLGGCFACGLSSSWQTWRALSCGAAVGKANYHRTGAACRCIGRFQDDT